MLLTPLLKGSDVPTKVGLLLAHRIIFGWLLPSATSDSYGYQQQQLNPGLLDASLLP